MLRYARTSDYVVGGLAAAFGPAALLTLEKFAPSQVGKGGFPKILRLATAIGLTGGFLLGYQRSASMKPRYDSPFPTMMVLLESWGAAFLRIERANNVLP